MCVVVWLLTGAGYPWPLWVAGPWGAVMAGRWILGTRSGGAGHDGGHPGGQGEIDGPDEDGEVTEPLVGQRLQLLVDRGARQPGVLGERGAVGRALEPHPGEHEEPGIEAGSTADLRDGDEVIGRVVRTRDGVKPLYVSIGHLIGLDAAVQLVLACCRGYRLPEPTRLAHQAAGGHLQNAPAMPG